MALRVAVFLIAFSSVVMADLYLHNPRGSNNRLNEANNNRNNGNRLFDSQNNNRGGYNVGDTATTDGAGIMKYMVGSILPIEWTNQHACGNQINHCTLILQYSCQDYFRDGTSTDTISEDGGENDGGDADNGKHELKAYYQACKTRERNKGLFLADQNLDGNTAKYTRQNPNGNRRGLECPEERDYYPYWHPTVWRDIAVITSRTENCTYYQTESENVKGKGYCSDVKYNNEAACTSKGATWSTSAPHSATFPTLGKPECIEAPWNRVNHHGTAPYNAKSEFAPNGFPQEFDVYNWTIPATPHDKCVFRIRYNISTSDYPDWVLNSTYNGKMSPIKQNPTVDIGDLRGLTLAINTNQFGRTFQDRSHVFSIIKRPDAISPTATIWNLNVRGRRGNIAQVYPAVEYDFIPKRLHLRANLDYVHWQWTGSNNNPNNDGQGRAQTDRSNVAQIENLRKNYPLPKEVAADPAQGGMFSDLATVEKFAALGQKNDKTLDDASPYQDLGLMSFRAGMYHYMCTRNNNFSNRSQKGTIIAQ